MKIVYCAYGTAGIKCLEKLMSTFYVAQILIFTHNVNGNEEFIKYLKTNKFNFFLSNINNFQTKIKHFKPDFLISVYYRTIIDIGIINLVNNYAMNLHPSLLPAYRGAKSSVWALLNNEKETGITFHYMNETIDSGNIILQEKIYILSDDTAYSIYHKLINLFTLNFIKAFNLMIDGYNGTKQEGEASYYSRSLPFGGRVKISEVNFKEASQFVKAMHFPPYKGAIFEINKSLDVEIHSTNALIKLLKKNDICI
tara:strand:- start:977 stop:1738 length:762 start_codon:yes stop_codon:yes gene_type:complete